MKRIKHPGLGKLRRLFRTFLGDGCDRKEQGLHYVYLLAPRVRRVIFLRRRDDRA